MDGIQVISQLISNLGFPIACVLGMFYMWNKEREEHKAEMQKITEAVNNNTMVIQKLIDNLDNNGVA